MAHDLKNMMSVGETPGKVDDPKMVQGVVRNPSDLPQVVGERIAGRFRSGPFKSELRRTAGKNGTPPLEAMPGEVVQPNDEKRCSATPELAGHDDHPDHGDLRLVTRPRPTSLAVRVQAILDNAVEYAWQALAEDRNLDPLTVGVCKRLHDWERGLWPSR